MIGAIIIAGDSSIKLLAIARYKLVVTSPARPTCIRLYEIYGFEIYINRLTGNLMNRQLIIISRNCYLDRRE